MWEAGTEVRDLNGAAHGRSYLPGGGAWILWGRFNATIIIANISSVPTLCQAGPELNSSPGLSHLIYEGLCEVFESVLGVGAKVNPPLIRLWGREWEVARET